MRLGAGRAARARSGPAGCRRCCGRATRWARRARLLLQGPPAHRWPPARPAVPAAVRVGPEPAEPGRAGVMAMPDAGSIIELVRLPAVLTVPGDSLLGSASAGADRHPART